MSISRLPTIYFCSRNFWSQIHYKSVQFRQQFSPMAVAKQKQASARIDFIRLTKWLHQGHLLSVSVRRRNLLEDRCVLLMICLRKQTVAMVVMNRCSFELESPFPASEKKSRAFCPARKQKNKGDYQNITLSCTLRVCGCRGLWVLRTCSDLTLGGSGFVE